MSNYRTTADLLDGVLRRCGELTASQGVSPRQTSALLYLNNIYQTIISGGNELNIDVDEPWIWAKHRRPICLQINPSITAGTVTVSYGSNIATLTNAPTDPISGASIAVQNYMLKPTQSPECYIVTSHTAGSTTLQLDANYSTTSATQSSFTLFQLDYDLTPSYIVIDQDNNSLDFVSNATPGTTVTATLSQGSYTPLSICGAITTALSAIDATNTYSASYDTTQRFFTVTSNLTAANAVFNIVGNGPNYYRSAWEPLGYDYLTLTSGTAGSLTSTYGLDSLVRFSQPGRIYYGSNFWYSGQGDGKVGMLDAVAFDNRFPLIGVQQGTPDFFCILKEGRTGKLTIRLNKYLPTTQAMKLEFDYIPEAKDLQNNTASIPIIPKSYRKILEYGASYYLSIDKQDTRADTYLGIAQQALRAMTRENRRELQRVGKNFGNVIARWDLMPSQSHRRLNTYGYDLLNN